jgi:hypothetical protein
MSKAYNNNNPFNAQSAMYNTQQGSSNPFNDLVKIQRDLALSNPRYAYDIYANQVSMDNYQQTTLQQQYNLAREQVARLEQMMLNEKADSPTNQELKDHPALKTAYDEMCVIWKLIGKSTK